MAGLSFTSTPLLTTVLEKQNNDHFKDQNDPQICSGGDGNQGHECTKHPLCIELYPQPALMIFLITKSN
jgi:hypothetical protein